MFLPTGTELQARYRIEGVLGHGGFGITYLAMDQLLNVKAAIKEYLPRQLATRAEGRTQVSVYTGEAREHYAYGLRKFLEEAHALARFGDHANIVSCRDFFEANGTAYMVMPYLEGLTLKDYLAQKGGRLPFEAARDILLPVMDALREVHSVHLLHRDISPDNIFLTTARQVKLIDFGAARYQAGEHSKSLSVILKTGYAPEEQYRSSGRQGPWTDVYAVAATLYKAITGQTPPDALDRLAYDTLVLPSQLGVPIPPQAEQTLLKALAVRGVDRFQTMQQFQEALLGITLVRAPVMRPRMEPVSAPLVRSVEVTGPLPAPPPARPELRPGSQIRRRWSPWTIAAPVIALVGLILVGLLYIKGVGPPLPPYPPGPKTVEQPQPPPLEDQLKKVLFKYAKAMENKDISDLNNCFSPHMPKPEKIMQEIVKNWDHFNFLGMVFNIKDIKQEESNKASALVAWQFQTRNRENQVINPHTLTYHVTFAQEEGQWRIKEIEKPKVPEN